MFVSSPGVLSPLDLCLKRLWSVYSVCAHRRSTFARYVIRHPRTHHARTLSILASIHASIHKENHLHASIHASYRYTCTDTYIRAWMCTSRIHPRIQRRIRAHIHAHIHPHIHPRIHIRIRAHVHAHIPCTPAMRAARMRALDGASRCTVSHHSELFPPHATTRARGGKLSMAFRASQRVHELV